MSRRVRLAPLTIAVMLTSACAGNRATVYVAPSNQTIETGTEMSYSGDGDIIYVYNHSTVPITVTGLHLRDCENIRTSCDVQRLRIQVPAGQRTNVATVKRDNPSLPYSFHYDYSWEPVHQQ